MSEEEIVFLKNHTKYEEKEIKILFDDFIKKFPRGNLTEDEFVIFYEHLFPFNDGIEIRDHVFGAYDREKNGHLKAKDFLLWIGGIHGDDCKYGCSARSTLKNHQRDIWGRSTQST